MNQENLHQDLSFVRRYLISTDHKVIAKQYLTLSLFWAVIGAATAYLIRWQIGHPDTEALGWGFIEPQVYNALVTMHGTIMVFFVAMPLLLSVLGNFLIPLMIGAKDMAFPKLNALSFWFFLLSSAVLFASFFVPGGAAAAGWTGYPPLSAKNEYTGGGYGMDLWLLSLALEFTSFLLGGINFLTTTMNLRAPGLTWFRLPILVWMQLTAALIFMLSVGPTIAGAILLLMDRNLGTTFYLPDGGGDPLLWQHLFWFFGHPEVYVLFLPGVGIMLEVISVFARKPVFAYRPIIYATIVGGFLSFMVWAHHQYVSGMDPRLAMPFSITTIVISVPFSLVIFSIIATLWGASMSFPTPMMFALGTLGVFIFGGLTGIFNGSAPVDIYIHDTYFVVAHFHYTLFSNVFFGGFAALYFWFPKMFGRMMNETLGKIHFWLTFAFFNAVFIPMHLVGLRGMMRRIANPMQYEFLKPLESLNMFITLMAILLILSQAVFVINFFWSMARGKVAANNPWQANTLEWTTSSPPPHENFDRIPVVYRWPYDYSRPDSLSDWTPQDRSDDTVRATAR